MLQGTHVLDWEMVGRSAGVMARVYPYFPSGFIVVSDTGNGLFALSLDAQ